MRTSKREKKRKGDLTKREMLLLMLGMNGDMAKADIEDMMETEPVYYKILGDSKRRGLVNNVRKDKLTSYRLTIAGEKVFDQMFPGVYRKNRGENGVRESLCKNTDRRMRRCMLGQVHYDMYVNGVDMFTDEKPEMFCGEYFNIDIMSEKRSKFYLRDEYKQYTRYEVRASRSCGLLFVPGNREVNIVYDMMDRNIEVYQKTENRFCNEIGGLIETGNRKRGNGEAGEIAVSALILGDDYQLIQKILENGKRNPESYYMQIEDKQKVSRITLDMAYRRMYFILNRRAGNLGMQLLIHPQEYEKLKKELVRLLKFSPGTSVNDGFTSKGESVHICMLPELKKLKYIQGEANERCIICLKSQLEYYKGLFGTRGVTYHPMPDEKVLELMEKLTAQ